MKNTQTQNQAGKLKRESRFILLILIIMFLVISQVLVLLVNSGSINQLPDPVSVNKQAITLDDLKAVNADLNEVRKSLNDINKKPDLTDDHVEVKAAESKPAIVPAAPEVVKVDKEKDALKAVNADLNEVRKSLNEINKKPDLKDDYVEIKKLRSKPVNIPPAPVVVKKDKEDIKPKQNITENKKTALVEKVPEAIVLTPKFKEMPVEKNKVTEVKPAYIKHDTKGNSLEDNMKQWTCVHDTNTGLMWEVKSEEDVMRNSNNLYSWYDPEHETLQGKADGGRCKGDTDCDTHAYVKTINKQNYCGHNDWHLPTREQMQTLVDFENGDVKINNQYFPRTKPSWYWTSTENSNKNDHAWYVLFRNGHALSDLKERPKHIRLVRVTNLKVSSN